MRMPEVYDRNRVYIGKLSPTSLRLTEQTDGGSASMVIPQEDPQLQIGWWVNIWTGQGNAGYYRVRSVTQSNKDTTRAVELEHPVEILDKVIYAGDYNKDESEVSATSVLKAALGRTDLWKLGSCEYTDKNPWKFSDTSVMNMIDGVKDCLEDCRLVLDNKAFPFKLSLLGPVTEAACELRMNRNATGFSYSISNSSLYTRLYPIGNENLRLDGDGYVERGTATYGVIEQTATNGAIKTKAHLKSWAKATLKRHCEPVAEISVTGLALTELTGEPFDRLTLGTICRVPLREYGITVTERITRLQWKDLIANPYEVTVTISSARVDPKSMSRKEQQKKSGRRKSQKDINEEILKKYVEEISNGFQMTASRITATENSIAQIKLTTDSITSSVKKAGKTSAGAWLDEMSSTVTQTADKISAVVSGVANSDGKVTAASIIAAINGGGSNIVLSADHINIDGMVSKLTSRSVQVRSLTANSMHVLRGGVYK